MSFWIMENLYLFLFSIPVIKKCLLRYLLSWKESHSGFCMPFQFYIIDLVQSIEDNSVECWLVSLASCQSTLCLRFFVFRSHIVASWSSSNFFPWRWTQLTMYCTWVSKGYTENSPKHLSKWDAVILSSTSFQDSWNASNLQLISAVPTWLRFCNLPWSV